MKHIKHKLPKPLLAGMLSLTMLTNTASAVDPVLTNTQLHAVLGVVTNFILEPVIPAGAIGNATANTDGTYTITDNSTSYELGTPVIAGGNTNRFSGFLPDARARGFSNADVIAIGGVLGDGTGFAGLTGTASASVPTSGTATYAARYTLVYTTIDGMPVVGALDGAATIIVDFDAGTLSISSPYLNFTNINISGTIFTSDATCSYGTNGCSGTSPMQGGFYGIDGIAGVYAGTDFAGAFYGTKNP